MPFIQHNKLLPIILLTLISICNTLRAEQPQNADNPTTTTIKETQNSTSGQTAQKAESDIKKQNVNNESADTIPTVTINCKELEKCGCCGKKSDIQEPIIQTTKNPFAALQNELFLTGLLITAWGIHFWHWFKEPFAFKSEHGFTQESSTGGADKTGHAFTSFVLADFLSYRLRKKGFNNTRSIIFGSSFAMGLMTWIEIGDGTSKYGFSWEDILADFLGISFSALTGFSPVIDDLFDFRVYYWPTSEYIKSGEFVADYSGMKFLMALRLSGIPPLKKTPLKFIEFHLGYYSRGFRTFDDETSTNRVLYFGMGLDFKEMLEPVKSKGFKKVAGAILSYYQLPYTTWAVKKWEHKWNAKEVK
jgi:hypothetical protein